MNTMCRWFGAAQWSCSYEECDCHLKETIRPMKELKLPAAWDNIMFRVREVLPSAFLAGGALRDLDNGRPVKDLDLFFTDPFVRADVDKALAGFRMVRWVPGDYMDAAREVSTAYTYRSEWEGDDTPEVNLIQLDASFNPASIVERVDFGLCQIGADVLGIVKTPAYEFDKQNHCFTLTRAETVDGVKRSLRRYDRLSLKYPGWPLNVPAEFTALVGEATITETFGG